MKKTIAVIFGGRSTEYSVSLQSSCSVLKEINQEKYHVLPIGITENGKWYHYTGDTDSIENNTWFTHDISPVLFNPDPEKHCLIIDDKEIQVDAMLPILHGINGEDGTVQGMAAVCGIPIIGCGILSSALCMDKARAHDLVSHAGIPCAKSIVIHHICEGKKACSDLTFPVFVKPVRAGSSIGIHRCTTEDEVLPALKEAFAIDSQVILEEEIKGFEVGCAVMGNEKLVVGRVDEIELYNGFFDFEEKYTLKTSRIHMPARITEQEEKTIQETAKQIYSILGCSGFARVDMFYTPEKQIFFNEVNTIPGFTSHSRYPNMMKGTGLSFAEMLDRIIGLYL